MAEGHDQKNPDIPVNYDSHDDNDAWDSKDRRHRLSQIQKQIAWRRTKVAEYDAMGMPQYEIAEKLKVAESTISGDKAWLREQAKQTIQSFTQERLPELFEKSLLGLTQIMQEAWKSAANSKYERNRAMFLKLAEECVVERMNMASNADVVEKTAVFVQRRRKVLEQLQEGEWDESQISDELPVPADSNLPIADSEEEPSQDMQIEVSHIDTQ